MDKLQPASFAEHYSSIANDDLVRLSADTASLLPDAREVLRMEMERRGLSVQSIDWTAQPASQPAKVGGWLLLYCIGAVIILPIWQFKTAIDDPVWVTVGLLPYSFLHFISAVLLWRRDSRGLRWARWGFLYFFIVACLILAISFLNNGVSSFLEALTGIASGSIAVILWWSYFRRSERVREIYGKNMDGLRH